MEDECVQDEPSEPKWAYYSILGLSKDAETAAIKKSYKNLALKWHPDKNPGNSEAAAKFIQIAEAFTTLSDPEKRATYDEEQRTGVKKLRRRKAAETMEAKLQRLVRESEAQLGRDFEENAP
eukprot:gnl/MRDRNA2_/MRDRNA2_65927_c0_seq1.p1 gnl/MRDRNA2_/MRDRNA2_65927_c0~~gnl/MRDRNA2_/MRDRNA2_65927_c0_seq1.p1  ORF type:complete len:122 (+),score=38.67 gnl/MRDRNA2_/MRDRNA2_65927_c0_seq1:208-573(+)